MPEKLPISQLKGFNAGVRPELIADDQASELINLRFDERGALVARNGAIMFDVPASEGEAFGIEGKGATVLAEYRIEGWDSEYDTNSFMLVGLRDDSVVGAGSGATPAQYGVRYILMPLTGSNRNRLSGDNCASFTTAQTPAGVATGVTLAAPRRQVAALGTWTDNGKTIDSNWIEHYVVASQFRGKMVISDRVNGDMLLCDKYDDAAQGEPKVHDYYLRQNALARFDVSKVILDLGLNSGGFNDVGADSGMALYKYYLPRITAISTDDHFGDYFAGTEDANKKKLQALINNRGVQQFANNSTFMTAGLFYSAAVEDDDIYNPLNQVFRGLGVNSNSNYTFSDYNEPAEIDDLFGKPTLTNPAVTGKDPERPADVYIWEDVKIKYYPCSGKEIVSGGTNLLKANDRNFDKLAPLLPRTIKLTTKTGAEIYVPLAVWQYRFAWDLGNGEYSAPSSPMCCPDVLWSALRDDSIDELTSPSYQRPVRLEGANDAEKHAFPYNYADAFGGKAFTSQSLAHNASPLIFKNGSYTPPNIEAMLSDYGVLFKRVKDALYSGVGHRFGSLYAYTSNTDFYLTGEFGVIMTANFGEGTLKKLTGTICESAQHFKDVDGGGELGDQGFPFAPYSASRTALTVPLFRGEVQEYYNSVFTDRGVPRTAFKPALAPTFSPTDTPPWQLALFHFSIPGDYVNPDSDTADDGAGNFQYGYLWHFALDGADAHHGVVFNIVPKEIGSVGGNTLLDEQDFNNADETSYFGFGIPQSMVRDPSQLRAVKNERDRLTYLAADIPAEAATRLIAQGTAELVLADFGERGTITNATRDGVSRAWADILTHADRRFYTEVEKTAPARGGSFLYKWRWCDNTYHDGGVTGQGSSGYCGPYSDVGSQRYVTVENLRVVIHGDGERLLIPEQLTSYFPSSVLWKAPRVKIRINADDIPPRAKQLIIFRTIATHNNDWVPDTFGVVSRVTVGRTDGVPDAIEFFDDIKDADIDFGVTPDEYDGLIQPLQSRFNIVLDDVVQFANFVERYRPQAPRDNASVTGGNGLSRSPNISIYSADGKLAAPRNVLYAFLYKDPYGIYSAPVFYAPTVSGDGPPITLGAGDQVLISQLPSASGQADVAEVWRGIESGGTYTWGKIGEIKPEAEGVFVDDDNPILATWKGNWVGDVENSLIDTRDVVSEVKSGLRYSRPNKPYHLRYEDFEPIDDDGEEVTGLAALRGATILFKENSIHRLIMSEGRFIRKDEVSDTLGCIAPNTVLSFNNMVYFLHRSGFWRYNGNGFERADGDFGRELMERMALTQLPGASADADLWGRTALHPGVRDASVGYNPTYNEIYLNVPTCRHEQDIDPDAERVSEKRKMRGHVYVINLDNPQGIVTKFAYRQWDPAADARTQGRIYAVTSAGEMRSAQILPENFSGGFSLVLLESPTLTFEDSIASTSGDVETSHRWQVDSEPLHTLWRSKYFDFGDKSIVKRLLKFIAHVRKGTNVIFSGGSHNEHYDSRAHEEQRWWSKTFSGRGELEAIPPRSAVERGEAGSRHPERGERIVVQIESDGDTFIDGVELHWKAVNGYMR